MRYSELSAGDLCLLYVEPEKGGPIAGGHLMDFGPSDRPIMLVYLGVERKLSLWRDRELMYWFYAQDIGPVWRYQEDATPPPKLLVIQRLYPELNS